VRELEVLSWMYWTRTFLLNLLSEWYQPTGTGTSTTWKKIWSSLSIILWYLIGCFKFGRAGTVEADQTEGRGPVWSDPNHTPICRYVFFQKLRTKNLFLTYFDGKDKTYHVLDLELEAVLVYHDAGWSVRSRAKLREAVRSCEDRCAVQKTAGDNRIKKPTSCIFDSKMLTNTKEFQHKNASALGFVWLWQFLSVSENQIGRIV
jgi:hypothetical protein